jgi:hypothetical protein
MSSSSSSSSATMGCFSTAAGKEEGKGTKGVVDMCERA